MRHRVTVLSRVLANPSLRRVELAFLGFGAAEYGVWVAVLVYAYQRGGTTVTAAIAVLQLIPAAIVAPLAAQMMARRGPSSVLRIGYTVQALAVGFTATMMLVGTVPAATYTGAVIAASAVTLTRPAQATLFPSLASTPAELTAVNVVTGWVESVTLLLGPALAGGLIKLDGPGAACALFAVALAGSAALVAALGDPNAIASVEAEPEGAEESPIPLSALRTEPGVMALLGLVAVRPVRRHRCARCVGRGPGTAGAGARFFGSRVPPGRLRRRGGARRSRRRAPGRPSPARAAAARRGDLLGGRVHRARRLADRVRRVRIAGRRGRGPDDLRCLWADDHAAGHRTGRARARVRRP
jgi:hypothetical protein